MSNTRQSPLLDASESLNQTTRSPLVAEITIKHLESFLLPNGSYRFQIHPTGLLLREKGVEYLMTDDWHEARQKEQKLDSFLPKWGSDPLLSHTASLPPLFHPVLRTSRFFHPEWLESQKDHQALLSPYSQVSDSTPSPGPASLSSFQYELEKARELWISPPSLSKSYSVPDTPEDEDDGSWDITPLCKVCGFLEENCESDWKGMEFICVPPDTSRTCTTVSQPKSLSPQVPPESN